MEGPNEESKMQLSVGEQAVRAWNSFARLGPREPGMLHRLATSAGVGARRATSMAPALPVPSWGLGLGLGGRTDRGGLFGGGPEEYRV